MKEMSRPCFSLDGGRTKFTDLIQMVEFYQVRKLIFLYVFGLMIDWLIDWLINFFNKWLFDWSGLTCKVRAMFLFTNKNSSVFIHSDQYKWTSGSTNPWRVSGNVMLYSIGKTMSPTASTVILPKIFSSAIWSCIPQNWNGVCHKVMNKKLWFHTNAPMNKRQL